MKTLRVLLVSVISFCLLNMQMVATTSGIKIRTTSAYAQTDECAGLPGVSERHQCYANANNGNNGTAGTNGTNSQNFQTTETYIQEGKDQEAGAGWLDQLTLLAIGFIVAGWFIKCSSPYPADMIIAAIGAAVLVIGEIAAIFSYQGTVAAMEMAYQADHEGKMLNNDDQVAAFRKELDNNESVEEALELKLGFQIAAEVAFGIALGVAIAFTIVFYVLAATCLSLGATLSIPPLLIANPLCPSAIAQCAVLMGLDGVPQISIAEYAQKKIYANLETGCVACTAHAQFTSNQYIVGCSPVGFNDQENLAPGFSETMLARLEKARPMKYKLAKEMATEYNLQHHNEDNDYKEQRESQREVMLDALADSGFGKIEQKHPIMSGISFTPSVNPENEDEFNFYLTSYENIKFKNGEIRSLSLDEFKTFDEMYSYKNLEGDTHYAMRDLLAAATEKGVDLIFPRAEANFGKLLTLVGGVLLALVLATSTVMDLLLGTGLKRGITYTGFVIAVGFGLKATNDDLDEVRGNIYKLNEILNNLSDLSSGPMTQHVDNPGGGGGGGKIDRPQIEPNGDQDTLVIGDQPTPCLGGSNPNGCNSIQEKYDAVSAVDGLDMGADLTSGANTVVGIGDGLSNTKSLSSGTLGKLNSLGPNKGAIFKNNRRLAGLLAAKRKAAKQKPVDIDGLGKKFLGDMRKAMLKKMKDDGMTNAGIRSALGKSGPIKKKGKGDKSLADAQKQLANLKKGNKAGPKMKKPKLDFGFGDDKAGVANADSAAEMDDPNAIGEDEEYVLDDIVKDEGASLWQIISVRYLKSGYNRLRGKDKKPAKISE